jgi:hypothetical protein
MPTYTFKLHDGGGGLEDETGVNLADDHDAVRYAHDVACELMKSRELETRCWQLDVHAAGGERICEIPFASIDPTLDHLPADWRSIMESIAERRRLLGDALHAVSVTVQESRALVARARGKPYLASRFGKTTIRGL